MPTVLGVNQLNVPSPGFPHEENKVLELRTGIKETAEERGLLPGSTDPTVFLNLAG